MNKIPPLKVVTVTTKTPPVVDANGNETTGTEKTEHILVAQSQRRVYLNHSQRRVRAAQQRKAIKRAKKIIKARNVRAKQKKKAVAASKELERTQTIENGEDQS